MGLFALDLYLLELILIASDFPKISSVAQDACNESIHQIFRTIHNIDMTIYQWNNILEKAQPLYPGRLIFRFLERSSWQVDGKSKNDKKPYPGKMVKLTSGRWSFVLLDQDDHYEKLSDLRVGKGMPSDALVKKLIDGIEGLLKERDSLESHLRETRMLVVSHCRRINVMADKMFSQDSRLRSRVKLDWKDNADEAVEALRAIKHAKYKAGKAKAAKMSDSTN